MKVPWSAKYLLASLPFVVTFGWWRLAEWAYLHFHCQGGLKDLQPCFAGSLNITPYVGPGLFFGGLLWIPAAVLSVVLALSVGEKHNRERIARGPSPKTHIRCPDCQSIIPMESRVCEHCGCRLIPQSSVQEPTN